MIAELALIVQLLEKLSLTTPVAPTVGPPRPDVIKELKPPDAPTPIRPPSGYEIDLDLIRYLK